MRKEILSFTDELPETGLIRDLEEAAVHLNGFQKQQDSFFVFVMRPDMIRELEHLAEEEGASGGATLLVCAFSDMTVKNAAAEAMFALHAMAAAAEKRSWAVKYASFAAKVFRDPSFCELPAVCGVPSGYGCVGAIAVGREKESCDHEARYNVFSYIQ